MLKRVVSATADLPKIEPQMESRGGGTISNWQAFFHGTVRECRTWSRALHQLFDTPGFYSPSYSFIYLVGWLVGWFGFWSF